MDTIIYFYKKDISKPEVEPAGQKTYMLIRVAVDVGEEEWFGTKTDRADSGRLSGAACRKEGGRQECVSGIRRKKAGKRFSILGSLRGRYAERRQRRKEEEASLAAEREEQRLEAEREQRLQCIGNSVRELSCQILELAGGWEDCYLVYENSVRRWLVADEDASDRQRRLLPALWKECFPAPEFKQHTKQFWVELLLQEAVLPHFVILGRAPCMYPLLRREARRMKSLCWILETTGCDQELEDFVEDFYEEYGLAITLQTFEPGSLAPWKREGMEAMRQLLLRRGPGANILDFTDEPCIAISEAAPGSIWLDMMSVEEKQRRAQAKGSGITYDSLKTKWKRAQKRCICPVLP